MSKFLPFLIASLFFFAQCQQPQKTAPVAYSVLHEVDTSCEIGYLALDLEKLGGFPVKQDEYDFLDRFVEFTTKGIEVQDAYSYSDVVAIFHSIDYAIKKTRKEQMSYHSVFSLCLKYRLFDCDINSFLYITVAERLGLPIQAILMPSHMAIVWQDAENTIYWETTEGKVTSKEYYRERYGLYAADMPEKMLLTPLNKTQLLSVVLFNMGKTFSELHYVGKSVAYTREAIRLTPNWFKPYNTLAHIYKGLEKHETAIYYANQALKLMPSTETYETLAISYTLIGCNSEAKAAYQAYLKLLTPETYDYHVIVQNVRARMNALEAI